MIAVTLLAACTPFGVWLYEEPTVGLDEVLIDTSSAESALPPYVILAVKNRNDYELSLRNVELVLRVDGRDVGSVAVDTIVTLGPIATRAVRLKVPPIRIAGTRSGTHRYGIVGRARLETPIGERRIGFHEEIRGEAAPTGAGAAPAAGATAP